MTRTQLGRVRDLLIDRVEAARSDLRLDAATITRRGGAPADRADRDPDDRRPPVRVRSSHVFAEGAEVVVDAYAPPGDFARLDEPVFVPRCARCASRRRAADVDGRRAFVVVLDACGAGRAPRRRRLRRRRADTLAHVAEAVGGLDLPVWAARARVSLPLPASRRPAPRSLHGRLHPLGPGKDTTYGPLGADGRRHPRAAADLPGRLPARDPRRAARGDRPRRSSATSPTTASTRSSDFGAEHLATGDLIVYTSADSVLQIAAHEDVVAERRALRGLRAARAIMTGEHAVGRVIARPFVGEPGRFERTTGRRDLSIDPPARSYLEELQDAGAPVHSVGKVGQVFAGVGITAAAPGRDERRGDRVDDRPDRRRSTHGLVFTNLVETDQLYGHRKDVAGLPRRAAGIDRAVAGWLDRLDPARDLLVLTADHGCDPTRRARITRASTCRCSPRFAGHGGRRHDGPLADVGASALRWITGREPSDTGLPGAPFVSLDPPMIRGAAGIGGSR